MSPSDAEINNLSMRRACGRLKVHPNTKAYIDIPYRILAKERFRDLYGNYRLMNFFTDLYFNILWNSC